MKAASNEKQIGAAAVRRPTIEVAKEFAGPLELPTHPPGTTPRNCALLYSSSSHSLGFKGVIRPAENGQLYWIMTRLWQTESGRLAMELELALKK